jgi:hypothetical protein
VRHHPDDDHQFAGARLFGRISLNFRVERCDTPKFLVFSGFSAFFGFDGDAPGLVGTSAGFADAVQVAFDVAARAGA